MEGWGGGRRREAVCVCMERVCDTVCLCVHMCVCRAGTNIRHGLHPLGQMPCFHTYQYTPTPPARPYLSRAGPCACRLGCAAARLWPRALTRLHVLRVHCARQPTPAGAGPLAADSRRVGAGGRGWAAAVTGDGFCKAGCGDTSTRGDAAGAGGRASRGACTARGAQSSGVRTR